MRRIEATVRLPGARMAPVIRTLACGQMGRANTGTKIEMTLRNGFGKESIARHPFGSRTHRFSLPIFCLKLQKLDKVELRRCRKGLVVLSCPPCEEGRTSL